jgi:O-methyltransferase
MRKIVTEIMKDFPGIKFIMLGDGQIEYIMDNLASVLKLPGDVVELGCNVGMTTSFLRRLLNAAGSDKEIHVYDSFQGLPGKTAEDGATPCDFGSSAVPHQAVLDTFSKAGLTPPVINKGWFSEIPDDRYPEKICFAFLDGDFYGSIMDSFRKVYHKMVPGGIILVHDYDWAPFPGVKMACDEFCADKPEKVASEIFGIGKMVKK